jgi:hypothetical protein
MHTQKKTTNKTTKTIEKQTCSRILKKSRQPILGMWVTHLIQSEITTTPPQGVSGIFLLNPNFLHFGNRRVTLSQVI